MLETTTAGRGVTRPAKSQDVHSLLTLIATIRVCKAYVRRQRSFAEKDTQHQKQPSAHAVGAAS